MSITMREVAQRAGVSKAAVSYVLNGRDETMRIPVETRERILKAVRDLGYYPNALARSLAYKETRTIAVVMQYPSIFSGWSGFTNELMHGITDAAIAAEYDVLLHTRNNVPRWRDETDAVQAEVANLTDGRVDGALLLRDRGDPLARMLNEREFPTVLMFSHSEDAAQWYVDCDNVSGGMMAVDHLLSLGHTRIVHLAGPTRSAAGAERREGYCRALEQAGLPIRAEWIVEVVSPRDDFMQAARLFEASELDRPTALFAWSDDVALQTMQVLKTLGLRTPEDVAVVGFDSTPLCDHTDPPLTSIRQPIYEMAAAALGLLQERLRGRSPLQTQVRIAPALDVRRSCGMANEI